MKWILLLLLTCVCCLACAQTETTYRLQVDDAIRIQVYREQEISTEVLVGRDGNITAPFLGNIRAVGKTTTELAEELSREYERVLRIKSPKVAVTILRFRSIRASIVGMVKRPDTYDVRQGDTVLTLIARAGGVDMDRSADLRRATLRRAGSGEVIPLDLYSMLNMTDTSQNYVIEDGDEIYVPAAAQPTVHVIGAVPQPGPIGYREGLTVADALSFARWEIRTRSMLSRTTVLRPMPGHPGQYLRIQVDMVKFIREGDSSQNILLQPGDTIWVPDTRTPDWDRLASVAGTIFYLNRFFTGDFFGFRVFGGGGN